MNKFKTIFQKSDFYGQYADRNSFRLFFLKSLINTKYIFFLKMKHTHTCYQKKKHTHTNMKEKCDFRFRKQTRNSFCFLKKTN